MEKTQMPKTLLWLDDIRNPESKTTDWLVFSPFPPPYEVIWAKNYQDFTKWILKNGLPTGICFDHDLGIEHYNPDIDPRDYVEKTGMDCAKWLVEYCINNKLEVPLWNCQSANPIGKKNINELLNNFKKSYEI